MVSKQIFDILKLIAWFLAVIVVVIIIYKAVFLIPPHSSQVSNFLKEESCRHVYYYSLPSKPSLEDGYWCIRYLRRNTLSLFGTIVYVPSNLPVIVILPEFAPFQYYNEWGDITNDEEDYVYTAVLTRDKGYLIFNPYNGEVIGSFDNWKDEQRRIDDKLQQTIANAKNRFLKEEKTTPNQEPEKSNTGIICSYNAYNCADFKSWAEAKKVYDACGGVNNDVHYLDRDKDGIPCETLR